MKHNSQMSQTQAVTQAYILTLIAGTDEQFDRAIKHAKGILKDATKAGLTAEQAKACRAAAIEIAETYPDLPYSLDGIKP